MQRKVTVPEIAKRKGSEPIVAITAYDFPFGRIVDQSGADLILVGDSLGMVVQGLDNTLPVTMDEIVYHCRMVARARQRALLVADLPFLSYQVSVHEALRNAGRLVKEGAAEAVKLEGGVAIAETMAAIASVDIPVMGHIGLTPQSVPRMGGHKVQGRRRGTALAGEIAERLAIPTIGIGAGAACDGQILVLHDVLGLCDRFSPKFAKRYAELWEAAGAAVQAYAAEVRARAFPTAAHSFHTLKTVPDEDKAASA